MGSGMLDEVLVEISHNCNLHCIICDFGTSWNDQRFMTLDNYRFVLSSIKGKTRAIRLNGRGESTIHPMFLEILQETRRECPSTTINLFSNLMFSSSVILNSLIECEVQLFVSMDSTDDVELKAIRRGARLSTIEANLEALATTEKRPFVVFTIQELNLHRILDIALFASHHNCNVLYNTISGHAMGRFVDTISHKPHDFIVQFDEASRVLFSAGRECLIPDQMAGIPIAARSVKRTCRSIETCYIIGKKLCIFHDGNVGLCNMLNPFQIGNIFESSPTEILTGNAISAFQRSQKGNKYCNNCANMGI